MSNEPKTSEFEQLMLPLVDFFMGLAMQLTRSRDQAEDLVQEALLKAYRSFSSFRPQSNFRAWVARILTNTFLTEQERAKRWARGVDLDQVPDPAVESYPSAELDELVTSLEAIPKDAFSDDVLSALHELPGDMAVAVYLADVKELPYGEIAEILEIPIGTVRSRISRGRKHLQRRLLTLAHSRGFTRKKLS